MPLKKQKTAKKFNFQQIILGIGIIVLLVAFILYGLEVFFPTPQYDQFCDYNSKPRPYYEEPTLEICEKGNGKWFPREGPCPATIEKAPCPAGYCDFDFYCRKEFDKAQERQSRMILLLTSLIGVGLIIAGLFVKISVVSSPLMIGGIIVFFRGVIGAWNFLSKYLQLALLGILLAVLLWVAYKRFGKSK
ncbi:hypothetical protein HY837_03340 [archaeon]|nr:hypothetical protein [archaeon]